MPKMPPKAQPFFWICYDCVRAEGWPVPDWHTPKFVGLCPWCRSTMTKPLVAVKDYLGPARRYIV